MTRITHKPYISRALLFTIALCFLSSCSHRDSKNDHAMAEQLFIKSVKLITAYTDSIGNTTDSTAFNRMRNEFDEKLAKVNFQFPPDTDLSLTEEENDSLVRLLEKLRNVIIEKDKNLIPADTVTDSITTVKPMILP